MKETYNLCNLLIKYVSPQFDFLTYPDLNFQLFKKYSFFLPVFLFNFIIVTLLVIYAILTRVSILLALRRSFRTFEHSNLSIISNLRSNLQCQVFSSFDSYPSSAGAFRGSLSSHESILSVTVSMYLIVSSSSRRRRQGCLIFHT